MTQQDIFTGVRSILHDHLNVQQPVALDTHIQRDLALDSLRQLTFVVELENRFSICFDPDDERGLTTLGDVVELVSQRLASDKEGTS